MKNNQLPFMVSLLRVSASTRPIIRVAVYKGIQRQQILWKICIIFLFCIPLYIATLMLGLVGATTCRRDIVNVKLLFIMDCIDSLFQYCTVSKHFLYIC